MALRALRAITIGLYEFCMFYEHRFANPLLLNIVKKTAGHSIVRPGIPNSCNSGI